MCSTRIAVKVRKKTSDYSLNYNNIGFDFSLNIRFDIFSPLSCSEGLGAF